MASWTCVAAGWDGKTSSQTVIEMGLTDRQIQVRP